MKMIEKEKVLKVINDFGIARAEQKNKFVKTEQENNGRSISDVKLVYKDKELNLMKAYAEIKREMDSNFKNNYISYLSYLFDGLLILDNSEKEVFEK